VREEFLIKKGLPPIYDIVQIVQQGNIVRSNKVLNKKEKKIKRGRKENFIFIFMIDILFKIYLHDGRQLKLNQWLETMIA
jgi:hypothetical protein